MHLELNEEQRLIQETAREFAAGELEPVAGELDRGGDRQIYYDNLKKLAELGFMGLNVKEQYGGAEAGVGAVCEAMVLQLLAVQRTSPAVGPCSPAATVESEVRRLRLVGRRGRPGLDVGRED